MHSDEKAALSDVFILDGISAFGYNKDGFCNLAG